jgi:hypothetical protein
MIEILSPAFHAPCGGQRGSYTLCGVRCVSSVPKTLGVHVSFFEIYGGKLFDLLNDRAVVRCLEDSKQQARPGGGASLMSLGIWTAVTCLDGGKPLDLLNDRAVVRCLEDSKQQDAAGDKGGGGT